MLTALASESVLLLGLVSALCAAVGVPDTWQKVVVAAVPLILAVLVRQTTSSAKTVARVVEQAALETATQLGTTGVGSVGTLTDKGQEVACVAATGVGNTITGLAGSLIRKVLAHD